MNMATDPQTIIDDPANDPPAADPPANDPPAADPSANDPPAQPPAVVDPAKDWRAFLSDGDADALKFLGRYQSAGSAMKGFKKLNDEFKSGKFIKPLDENSTDEEKAAFRTAMDVPDKPEAYTEKLPDGLVIGPDDKPLVDQFVKSMHEANAPKGVVHAALSAYYDIVDAQVEAEDTANKQARQVTEDALRDEWGGDYRRNTNVLKGFIDAMPDGLGDVILGARVDGVQLLNNPTMVKWLMDQALRENPLATVVPGAGANSANAIADEIAAIEKTMREDRKSYTADEKMQARYRELLDARDRLGGN